MVLAGQPAKGLPAVPTTDFDKNTAEAVVSNMLSGESKGATYHTYNDLTSATNQDTIQNILERDFFDLATLIPKKSRLSQPNQEGLDITRGPNSSLTVIPKPKGGGQINSFEFWVLCFTKYA